MQHISKVLEKVMEELKRKMKSGKESSNG